MTNEQILEMVTMRVNGATLREIAEKFNISREYVRQCMPKQMVTNQLVENGWESIIYPALKEWVKEHEFSNADLAKKTGTSQQHINAFLRGNFNPRKSTIDKILALTGMTYEQAFRKDGDVTP